MLSALLMCSYTLFIASKPFSLETWFVDCSSFKCVNVHIEGFGKTAQEVGKVRDEGINKVYRHICTQPETPCFVHSSFPKLFTNVVTMGKQSYNLHNDLGNSTFYGYCKMKNLALVYAG